MRGKIPDGVANHLNTKEEAIIRNGVMHRITGGMQQIRLKKGDLVVNHKQLEELEKGEVKSGGGRAKLIGSFAHGTLDGIHSFGSGAGRGLMPTKNGNPAKASSKSSKSTKSNTKATNDHTKATKSSTKSLEEFQKACEKLYDWIEVWLDRQNRILENYETQSELRKGKLNKAQKKTLKNYSGDSKRSLRETYRANNPLDAAYNLTKKDLKLSRQSAAKYLKQANSITVKTGKSKEDVAANQRIIKAIQNGRVADIGKYGEETRTRIEEYKKWYDKYLDVLDQQLDWQQKLKDLEQQKLDNIEDYFSSRVDYWSARQDVNEAQRSYLTSGSVGKAGASPLSKKYSKTVSSDVKAQKQQSKLLKSEEKRYKAELKTAKKRFGKNSQEYKDAQTAYQNIRASLKESLAAEVQLQKDYEQERIDYIKEHYDTLINYYSGLQDVAKSEQGLIDAQGGSRASKAYSKTLTTQLKEQQRETSESSKKVDKLKSELAKAAKIFGKGSDEYKTAQTDYNAAVAAMNESKAAEYQLRDAIYENTRYLKALNVTMWERTLSRVKAAGEYYSSRPNSSTEADRTAVWAATQTALADTKKIDELMSEVVLLRKQSLTYDKTSEQYQNLADQINSDLIEIMNLGTDIYDQMENVFKTYTARFERNVDVYSTAIDEMQHLIGLIGTESTTDVSGQITQAGLSTLALYASSINENTKIMGMYGEAIDEVNEMLAKGYIAQDDANDLIKQYTQGIQSAVEANKSYKQSILDIYRTQLQKENQILQDNIDKRKQALSAKEDYYNYDKSLKKTNKDIQSLQSQIKALSNSSNAYANARRLQLQQELEDLQEERDDYTRQHRVDLTISGYDTLANDAQKALDDTLDALETNTRFQEDVITNMLMNVAEKYGDAYDGINNIIKASGTLVSDTCKDEIEKFGEVSSACASVATAIQSSNSSLNTLNDFNASGIMEEFANIIGDDNDNVGLKGIEAALQSASKAFDAFGLNALANLNAIKIAAESVSPSVEKVADNASDNSNSGTGNVGQAEAKKEVATEKATAAEKAAAAATAAVKSVVASGNAGLTVQPTAAGTAKTSGVTNTSGALKKVGLVNFAASLNPNTVSGKVDTVYTNAEIKAAGWDTPGKEVKVGNITGHISKNGYVYFNTTGSSAVVKKWDPKTGTITTIPYSKKTYESYADKNSHPYVYKDFKNVLKSRGVKGYATGGTIDRIIPLRNLANGDDGIITAQLGEAVMPKVFMQDVVPEFINSVKQTTKLLQPIGGNGGAINVHYDSLLTVNGNVDRDALPGLKQILQQSYEYTSQKMYKDLRKIGYK